MAGPPREQDYLYPTVARRRPWWMHIVFWSYPVLGGSLLGILHAPEWAGFVLIAVGAFTILPWFMIWRPRG